MSDDAEKLPPRISKRDFLKTLLIGTAALGGGGTAMMLTDSKDKNPPAADPVLPAEPPVPTEEERHEAWLADVKANSEKIIGEWEVKLAKKADRKLAALKKEGLKPTPAQIADFAIMKNDASMLKKALDDMESEDKKDYLSGRYGFDYGHMPDPLTDRNHADYYPEEGFMLSPLVAASIHADQDVGRCMERPNPQAVMDVLLKEMKALELGRDCYNPEIFFSDCPLTTVLQRLDTLKLLHQYGADLEAGDFYRNSLYIEPIDLSEKNMDWYMPLVNPLLFEEGVRPVMNQRLDKIQFLLEQGANPDGPEKKKSGAARSESPLHICTSLEAAKLLRAHGAKLDIRDSQGRTPLEVQRLTHEDGPPDDFFANQRREAREEVIDFLEREQLKEKGTKGWAEAEKEGRDIPPPPGSKTPAR